MGFNQLKDSLLYKVAAYLFILSIGNFINAAAQDIPTVSRQSNKLIYTADSLGNRIPDFSYAGYMAGENSIPDAPVKVIVPPTEGDATALIQSAIDHVSSMPMDHKGMRGAVLLAKGRYIVNGALSIRASGVVLRGCGMGEDGTTIIGAGKSRETLIRFVGQSDRTMQDSIRIDQDYVPVNAMKFKVASGHGLKKGDQAMIVRPSVKEWIQALSSDDFGGDGWLTWKPGSRDLVWDRTIIDVNGDFVTIEGPITTALDKKYGGGYIAVYHWPGRISQAGLENVRLVSEFDHGNPKDEDHRWMAVTMENIEDAWIRQVSVENFAGSAVALYETAKRVTVEDCMSLNPVSEIGGQRRYAFYTQGHQTLFQRCYSEYGYHDFAVGFRASGPNAFVQCESKGSLSFSGAIDSWASGALFDIVNIDGNELNFINRWSDNHGAGWTAANSMFWQCTAAKINNFRPPTAYNWAYGAWAQFAGNGYWESYNDFVQPRSLYYGQLAARVGEQALNRANLLPVSSGSSSSPTIEQAQVYAAESVDPPIVLKDWIIVAAKRTPIPTGAEGAIEAKPVRLVQTKPSVSKNIEISNGWVAASGKTMTGKTQGVRWWRGDIRYDDVEKASPHITRFAPGRYGRGLTDSIPEVAKEMIRNHVVALDHNYGLWYDRRRDDHERVRRQNGEVWPPFYELPFARSGKGTAWDGLSLYDLTKYNEWYWSRLKEFANIADREGLILIHQNYFQHNIIEAGAHWADFPWRSANNVNNTDFPEPPPYAGDKRIFQAHIFYDTAHAVRNPLHKAYIRKCLDTFRDNQSVIHSISAEYTGPLHFMQFWIDVIMEWEQETGVDTKVCLSATKDVQDAILSDPVRAAAVEVIDIRYWHYRDDGSLYAPEGGKNLAPRQHARLVKPGKESFESVYRAVKEYRSQYPGKAVVYSSAQNPTLAWAAFMAGGSLPAIPEIQDDAFLKDATAMAPMDDKADGGRSLVAADKGLIIYQASGESVSVDLTPFSGRYSVHWIDPETGEVLRSKKNVRGGNNYDFQKPSQRAAVLWVSKR